MEKTIDITVSERLKLYLHLFDMSSAELSRKTKIDNSLLSKYIKGQKLPKESTVIRIAESLGINPEWLLGKPGADIGVFMWSVYKLPLSFGIFFQSIRESEKKQQDELIDGISKMLATIFRTDTKYSDQYLDLLLLLGRLNSEGIKDLIIKAYNLLDDESLVLKSDGKQLLVTSNLKDYESFYILKEFSKLIKGEKDGINSGQEFR